MSTFDDRERAFEAKFAHDAEMQFMAEASRTKRLGLWAGRTLGKSEEDTVAYARELMKLDLTRPGVEEVIERIEADFAAAAVTPEVSVREKATQCLAEAKAALIAERE